MQDLPRIIKDLALWVNSDERVLLVIGCAFLRKHGTRAMGAAGLGAASPRALSGFEPRASLSGWGPSSSPAPHPQTNTLFLECCFWAKAVFSLL